MEINVEKLKQVFLNTPQGHIAAYYSDENLFLDSLVHFLKESGDDQACIILAKPQTMNLLNKALSEGVNPIQLSDKRFTVMNSTSVLNDFMVNDMPQKKRFISLMRSLIIHATRSDKPIRIYNDMVATLWESGNMAAAIELERLWNVLGKNHTVSIYCAYPVKLLELKEKKYEQIDQHHTFSTSLIYS